MKVRTLNVPSVAASAVPTSTGATAAGSVRGPRRHEPDPHGARLAQGRFGNREKSGLRLAL
jgi:hypothetical protein